MPPATLLIKPVSNSCNMRCQYCFYADVSKHRSTASYGAMSLQTLETLVRKTFNYAEGYCSFAFQGGEPTLAGIDFFENFVRLQREYNINNIKVNNSVQTNGYKLGGEWAEFFVRHNFLTGISLDGTKAAHDNFRKGADGLGTYDDVVRTVDLFMERGVDFNILCVVNNLVASQPENIYKALKKYKYIQFIPCIEDFDSGSPSPYSLDADNYARFLISAFDFYYDDYMRGDYVSVRNFDNYIDMLLGNEPEQCGMTGVCMCYFLVEADGGVYPCDFYVLDEWKIGNVNENSFTRMMKSAAAREFVETSLNVHADCVDCEWRSLCRGGCRRHREPFFGGVLSKNVLCGAYKKFFQHSIGKMQRIASSIRYERGSI